MKKAILLFTVAAMSVGFTSCREKADKETVVVREVKVDSGEDTGILERAGQKVDDKVNDKIDNEIDKIDNK
ncbi:MAG: hypothetical protein V7767_13430 [Leeuwenhoekiella sp.]